jgi:hypothetical protein
MEQRAKADRLEAELEALKASYRRDLETSPMHAELADVRRREATLAGELKKVLIKRNHAINEVKK